MPVRTKRWNDRPEPDDGFRLLVCRYRPRGVPRTRETWDEWWSALGPSRELLAAYYGKEAPRISWDEYARRYYEEMTAQTFLLRALAARVANGETVTLLCSSACTDPDRCHRTLLARLVERRQP